MMFIGFTPGQPITVYVAEVDQAVPSAQRARTRSD